MDHNYAHYNRPAGRVERAGEPQRTGREYLCCQHPIHGRGIPDPDDSRDADRGTRASDSESQREHVEFRDASKSSGNTDADAHDHRQRSVVHRLGWKHDMADGVAKQRCSAARFPVEFDCGGERQRLRSERQSLCGKNHDRRDGSAQQQRDADGGRRDAGECTDTDDYEPVSFGRPGGLGGSDGNDYGHRIL